MVVAQPRMTGDTSPAMYETEPLRQRCEHVGSRIQVPAARSPRQALAPIGCLIAPEQRQLLRTVLKETESQSREAAEWQSPYSSYMSRPWSDVLPLGGPSRLDDRLLLPVASSHTARVKYSTDIKKLVCPHASSTMSST